MFPFKPSFEYMLPKTYWDFFHLNKLHIVPRVKLRNCFELVETLVSIEATAAAAIAGDYTSTTTKS